MSNREALAAVSLFVLATTPFPTNVSRADQKAKQTVSKDAVATLGDRTITGSELEELAKDRLARIRSTAYLPASVMQARPCSR